MRSRFGPWATQIDAGGNPQLSAFWRRRMGMLATASQASAALSRQSVNALLAVAICVFLLPTLETTPAATEPERSASADSQKLDGMSAHAPPGARNYTGTVVDKLTGKPIAGAAVAVRRMIVSPYELRPIETTHHSTDAAGKYRFILPPEQVAQAYLFIEVEASHRAYVARKDHYGFAMIHRNEQFGQRPFFERMELYPGQQISGTVVTPDGKPAAGIKVLGFTMPDRGDIDSHHFPSATTDAKGLFCLTVARSDNQSVSGSRKGCDAVFWLLPKDYALSTHVIGRSRDSKCISNISGSPCEGTALISFAMTASPLAM